MIKINNTLSINDKEVNYRMIKSSGPGGQNINKNSTAVILEIDIHSSKSIPINVKKLLLNSPHSFLTKTGKIIIKANNHRSQNRNKNDAISRLVNYNDEDDADREATITQAQLVLAINTATI